jgi:glycosyltransferase involved in cell wall biosynthesis
MDKSAFVMNPSLRPRVLLVLNHAPHYREQFLRLLGNQCELVVMANACGEAGLLEPEQRLNYRYVENESKGVFRKLPLRIHVRELVEVAGRYDVVIVTWDLHHVMRYLFPLIPGVSRKFVWSGHFYGTRDNRLLTAVRTWFVNRARGVVCYSTAIREKLIGDGAGVPIQSFNNSQVSAAEIESLDYYPAGPRLRVLFVGRDQPRKKLRRLVSLAMRRPDLVEVTVAGIDIDAFMETHPDVRELSNFRLDGPVTGQALRDLFGWCDLVVNPGHLGLLVVNAGAHGRAIVVASEEQHAPEVVVAHEAEQFFVDWADESAVDSLLERLRENRGLLMNAAARLVSTIREGYTIETMVSVHMEAIRVVCGNDM